VAGANLPLACGVLDWPVYLGSCPSVDYKDRALLRSSAIWKRQLSPSPE
jgi:hypothetical protein